MHFCVYNMNNCVRTMCPVRVAYKNVTKGGIRGAAEEVMTVTTHPPCTTEIPSVESEWVVIGGVGRGIHHHWCVHMY